MSNRRRDTLTGMFEAIDEDALDGKPESKRQLTSIGPQAGTRSARSLPAVDGHSQAGAARNRPVDDAELQGLCKDLVVRLAMLLKTVRIHSVQNSALQYSIKIFTLAVNVLFGRLSEISLRGDVDSIFVNDQRVRPEPIVFDNIVHLLEQFALRDVGGLRISAPLDPPGARAVLQILAEHPHLKPGTGPETLNRALDQKGMPHVRFTERQALVVDLIDRADPNKAMATQAVHAYTRLMVAWQAYLATSGPSVPEIVRSRVLTAVQGVVDSIHDDPQWVLAATSFRRVEHFSQTRAANAAVLSVALGQRLELGRKALMNLGMTALFADAGFRTVPEGRRHTNQWGAGLRGAEVRSHPLRSVREILQTPALTRAQRDRILVAYEHHIGHDGAGYPDPIVGKALHLFSRVVAIADRFDELCWELPGAPAMSPSRALEVLWAEVDSFDERLLRVFTHLLGPFPVGTLVELSTGEWAVVSRLHHEQRLRARPKVQIVRNRHGEHVRPTFFDLSEASDDGIWLAHIVRALDPGEESLHIARAIFSAASESADSVPRLQ